MKAKKNGEKQMKKVLRLVSLLLRWMDNFISITIAPETLKERPMILSKLFYSKTEDFLHHNALDLVRVSTKWLNLLGYF